VRLDFSDPVSGGDPKGQRERADGELKCFAMDIDNAEAALQLAAAEWAGQP